MQGTKQMRQLLLSEVAVRVLREQPSLLHGPRLRQIMESTRRHSSGPVYRECLDEWDRLLSSGDIELIALHVLSDDEHGDMMRATSPLAVLLTRDQREDVARRAV